MMPTGWDGTITLKDANAIALFMEDILTMT